MSFDSLGFSAEYFRAFADRRFTPSDRARVLKAMELLDQNEKHPSLRVHLLSGELRGLWSASVTDSIRIVFLRTADGRKLCVNLTKHYED